MVFIKKIPKKMPKITYRSKISDLKYRVWILVQFFKAANRRLTVVHGMCREGFFI